MTVVKCGGSVLPKLNQGFASCMKSLQQEEALVMVHGGGALIAELEEQLRLASQFNAKGQRITNEETLWLVTQCLCGLVNSRLVSLLAGVGLQAFGLSGIDGGLLKAKLKNFPELGWVGEITQVRADILESLCSQGFLPVVAPVSLYDDAADADQATPHPPSITPGQLLNVNADDAAVAIARSLAAKNMIFISDIPGVMDAQNKILPNLRTAEITQLIAAGVIYGGMIPKVEAAVSALHLQGSRLERVYIVDGRAFPIVEGEFAVLWEKRLTRGTCIMR